MRSFILVIIMILGITGCSFDKTVSFTEKTEVKTQYQYVHLCVFVKQGQNCFVEYLRGRQCVD